MEIEATKQSVEERIEQILVSFGAEESAIGRDVRFEVLDIDSLDLVELAQILEEEYTVRITSEDLKSIDTVGDAVNAVVAHMP